MWAVLRTTPWQPAGHFILPTFGESQTFFQTYRVLYELKSLETPGNEGNIDMGQTISVPLALWGSSLFSWQRVIMNQFWIFQSFC